MATIMVQGVSSDAGKSLIATALCRWLRRQGALVAPFKAQNMSNNARVVDGGEIGTAQWLQALAADVAADVRMNPVLLKPEADTRSQVVVNGVVSRELTGRRGPAGQPGCGRTSRPPIARSPPSTTSWWSRARAARRRRTCGPTTSSTCAWPNCAGAPVLLVADIDRGGAFAHPMARGRCCHRPGGRTSAGFCSTSSAAMSACWPRRRRSWSRPRGCRPSAWSPGSSTRCPTRRAPHSARRAVAAGASASSAGPTPPTWTSSSGSSRSPTSVGHARLLG